MLQGNTNESAVSPEMQE